MGGLTDHIFHLIGARVTHARPLNGGDLSVAYHITLQGGDTLVAKSGSRVGAEGRMLTALAEANAPAPRVLAQNGNLLLMEALTEDRPGQGSWEALGRATRALHDVTGERFGWDEDYGFGPVNILNHRNDNWPDFWAGTRLLPHIPHVPGGLAHRITTLCEALPRLLPSHPAPALLHGDLWAGNVLFGPAPSVHFIDPACYYGHSEVDLAMLHLFGHPGAGFDDGYGPLPPGWEVRRTIYTLWPALVHLRLFGSGYRGMVDRLLSELGV